MKFRTLTFDDAARLLEFELANRIWFEKTVLCREHTVYSEAGIMAHIASCLADCEKGRMHPGIMLASDGAVAGRANLKDIDAVGKSAEVGYRIGEQYAGQGWATACLQYLQKIAYEQYCLSNLQAFVTTKNLASARVLEKCGFARQELIPKRSLIQNVLLDTYRYSHTP